MQSNQKEIPIYEIFVFGDAIMGKTRLVERFIHNSYPSDTYQETFSVNFYYTDINVKSKIITLRIWDVPVRRLQQFSFPSNPLKKLISRKQANWGAMIVFDINSYLFSDYFEKWVKKIYSFLEKEIPIILVGSKVDLDSNYYSEAKQTAVEASKNYGFKLIETSAKTGENVSEAFEKLAILMMERY